KAVPAPCWSFIIIRVFLHLDSLRELTVSLVVDSVSELSLVNTERIFDLLSLIFDCCDNSAFSRVMILGETRQFINHTILCLFKSCHELDTLTSILRMTIIEVLYLFVFLNI